MSNFEKMQRSSDGLVVPAHLFLHCELRPRGLRCRWRWAAS